MATSIAKFETLLGLFIMGTTMILREAVESLDSLDENNTIYAVKPWTGDSEVIVAPEPETGVVPAEAARLNMKYFLEVFIARDFVNDWMASLPTQPTLEEKCNRLVHYAVHDA